MKFNMVILLLMLLLQLSNAIPATPVATAASLQCSSSITQASFACVGVPIQCTLTLNAPQCNVNGFVPQLNDADLTVDITQVSTFTPAFEITQTNATVVMTVDYLPTQDSATVGITITSTRQNCTFSVAPTPLQVSLSEGCNYPTLFALVSSSPNSTMSIDGGDIIIITLEVAVTDPLTVENVTFAYSLLHPALKHISTEISASNPGATILDSISADNDHHNLLSSSFTPLLQISSLAQGDSILVNFHFQLQPYALPQAILYISLHLFHHYSSFSSFALQQNIDQLRNYTVSEITLGNITVNLPYYYTHNYEPDTFPSQERDLFTVAVPVLIPCVSTDLTVNILLPEFWSDFYTRYFVNITHMNFTAPSNLMSIPHLCDYTDNDATLCDFEDLSSTEPISIISTTFEEQWAEGRDNITVRFGSLMYNMTTGPSCANSTAPINCTCVEQELEMFMTVLVLTDMICENQTVADNITTTLTHTADMSTWVTPTLTHTEPTIVQYEDSPEFLHAVNASTPAISHPVSSHSGDAGDPFVVTFGVLHNAEYSKFTAYHLNYTFSIDTRLDPEEFIEVCFFESGSDPLICEYLPFINYTIVREGFHEVFSLHVHRVELTINVTVVQEVAPGISFCNPGDSIFQALHENYTLNIPPLVCTNASCGNVVIDPVILHPWVVHWSDVPPTATEDIVNQTISQHHVTIEEQFNTTIEACMPECLTGVNLYVSIPTHGNGMPKLTVDDAYVTFIGSQLFNTTLFEGDNLASSENITVSNDGSMVRFFFGPKVLVPKDNILIADEQCFEIGLLCTVANTPVFHGDTFRYSAFVETDFGIRTSTQHNTMKIVEPDLITTPSPIPGLHDAGDIVTSVILIEHSTNPLTSGFRLNLTVMYPTKYLYLNDNDVNSTILLLNGETRLFSVSPNTIAGTVMYSTDELQATDTLEVTTVFKLTQNVVNGQNYSVDHLLDWHNLPYELPAEGRYYNTTGSQEIQIAGSQLSLSYTTSDENTLTSNLQLQEFVFFNVTVTPPEGISPLTVELSHFNRTTGQYPLNITYGELLRVGSQIQNTSIALGDNSRTVPEISITENLTVIFSLGNEIVNIYDNVVNEGDEIVLYVEGYVSNEGNGLSNQDIVVKGRVIEEPLVTDNVTLRVVHPQLQAVGSTTSPGPWDAGDTVNLTVLVEHSVSDAYIVYDLKLTVELDSGPYVNGFTLLDSSTVSGPGPSCNSTVSMFSLTEVIISSLRLDCVADIRLEAVLFDTEVIAGNKIFTEFALFEYFAVPVAKAILPRLNYGPLSNVQSEQSKTPTQLFQSNITHPLNYVAPFQTIEVTLTLTVPEGITQDVSITFNTTVTSPGDPSSVNLTLSLQSTVIHPTSTETTLPYLGNITNPPDNIVSVVDTIVVVLTLDVPDNPSTPFTIFAITTYNTDSGIQQLVDRVNFVIVRPEISVTTEALSTRLSRIAYTEDLNFDLTIERADSNFPDYDVLLDVTLELPSGGILTPSLGDLSVDTLSVGESLVTVMLSGSTLSYVSNVPAQLFHFEGNMLPNLTNGFGLRLNGSVIYSVDPSTSVDYANSFMFPVIYFLEPSLAEDTLEFILFTENPDIVVWELILVEVAGSPFDLIVDVFVDTAVINLQLIEVSSVGNGLEYDSTDVSVSTAQGQLVFHNLSSFFNETVGICFDCVADIVLLVTTELVNEVGLRNSLVNATGQYTFLTVMIEASNVALVTDFSTNNPDTVGNVFQVGEVVTLNVTILPPENIAKTVTLNMAITQNLPMDYPVIVSAVSIVHIGANIVNAVLSVGDSDSASYISINSSTAVTVEMGELQNTGDGVINEDDQVVVSVTLYAQNTGTGATNQIVTLDCFIEEEPFVRDSVILSLTHPQLEMNLVRIGIPGTWDGNDTISFSTELVHQVAFDDASAYDLQLSVISDLQGLTDFTLEYTNTTGSSCFITSLSCISLGSSIFSCSSLPVDCAASLVLSAKLPTLVVSGNTISVTVTLQYDSHPFSTPHIGTMYTPLIGVLSDQFLIPTQLLQSNITHPLNYVAPFQTIEVTLTLTVPEGITQDVSITFNTTVTSPGDPSSVSLTLSLQSTVIHPTSTETMLPYLGNITNPPDNTVSVDDTIVVVLTLDVPNNPSTPFTIFAITTYNTDSGIQQLVNDLDFVIVRPEISVTTEALSVRLSRLAYTEDLNFDLTIERADSNFPDYDILLDVTLELPSGGILTPSLGDLSVDTLSAGESLVTVMLSRSTLSYVSNVPAQLFHFEGNMLPNLTNGYILKLNGSVIYSVDPPTSVNYIEYFNYPDIYFLSPSIVADRLAFNSFTENPDIIVWELVLTDIGGAPFDLTVDIFVDTAVLNLQFVDVLSVGEGLEYVSTGFLINATSQRQVVFHNLSLVFIIGDGICSNCSVDIVMSVHTELVNEVGLRNSLVNATGRYSDLLVMVEAINVALVTDFSTTNPDTVGNVIQVGEIVTVNITISPPENVTSNVTLSATVTQPLMDYPVIVSTVSIVHIGANIVSTVLSVGDTDSASYIIISTTALSVEMGEIKNTIDGIVNEDDQVVVSVTLYAQNTGSGTANQVVSLDCFIEEEPFVRDNVILTLIHPQLEMNLVNVGPPGPYDGQDPISISIELRHQDSFPEASAYDLQFSVISDPQGLTELTVEYTNTTGSMCSLTSLSCTMPVSTMFSCSSLPVDCAASIVLSAKLPTLVVSGNTISVTVTLQYDSHPFPTPYMGLTYTPLMGVLSKEIKIPTQLFQSNITHPLNYVAPFQTIEVTLTLTVPEGITQDVSITFNTTVTSPVDPSSVNLTLTLQSAVIHPTSTETMLPYLGNITNPPDNIVSVDDTIVVVLTLDVPDNPSTPFTIFAITTYNTDSGIQQLVDEVNFVIVRPELNITTEALSVRLSRLAYTEDLNFDLTIERADSNFPDYDILLDATLELPSGGILTPSLGDLSVDTLSAGESLVTVMLSRSTLSYVSNVPVQLFHFEGNMLPNLTNGYILKLNGSVIYSVDPSTSVNYIEYFNYPDIYFLSPSIVADRLAFNSFAENPDIIIWELVLTDIGGAPFDLTVDIFVDTAVLNLQFVDVLSVGEGLEYVSTGFLINATSQRQVVFHNLSSVFIIGDGICSNCSVDIVMSVHTELINEIGLRNSLVNATGYYSDLTVMVEANNVAIVTDFITTNPDTNGNAIQVGEIVTLNVVLYFSENVASIVTLIATITQTLPMDYPVIVSTVSIVHIGANIVSTVLSVGDTDSASYIIISTTSLSVEMGEVKNNGDGVMNEDDQVIVSVTFYAQNTGTGTANQAVTVHCIIEEEPFVRDNVILTLIHPQLEMNLVNVGPPGPYDGQDPISISIELRHQDSFPEASAYDLQFSVISDPQGLTELTVEYTNTTGSMCSLTSLSCTMPGSSMFSCSSLPVDCAASLVLSAKLPTLVVSGNTISVTVTLQYDSHPFPTPHMGLIYTPLMGVLYKEIDIPTQLLQSNITHPLNYVAPFQTIEVTLTLTVPEGITQDVSITFNTTVTSPVDPSSVNLTLTLQSTVIHPTSTETTLPYLGNITNPSDNIVSVVDTIVVVHTLDVPNNPSTPFTIFAITTYNTDSGIQQLVDNLDFLIVRPELNITTEALSVRQSRVAYTEDLNFDLTIERTDSTFPDYDVLLDVALELPSGGILTPSLGDLSVDTLSVGESLVTVMLSRSSLSYVSNVPAQLFHFEGSMLPNLTNGYILKLNGSVIYSVDPSTSVNYIEYFSYPDIYFLSPSLVAERFTFNSFAENPDIIIWELVLTDIGGAPFDLTVDIFVDTAVLNLQFVDVLNVGEGLEYVSTGFLINATSQRQVVFHNLSSVFIIGDGICSNCSVDIVMSVHTELVNEVGLRNSLVNATGYYSDLTVMVEANNVAIVTDFITTNPDTVGNAIQVGEVVTLNVILYYPENVASIVTLNATITQTLPTDYPVIVSTVSIVHIGANIASTVLSVGDTDSASYIIISTTSLSVEMGEVRNNGDGVMNEDDQVIVSVTLYAQNMGTGTANQVITFDCVIEEEPFVRDNVILTLVHPQLEMNLVNVGPPSPYDGQDPISISIELRHQDSFPEASAYDLQFSVISDPQGLTELTVEYTNTTSSMCSLTSLSCTMPGSSMFSCSSLPVDCAASLVLSAKLPTLVVSGNTISVTVTLQYDSHPFPTPHMGLIYTPLMGVLYKEIDIPTQLLQSNITHPLNYVAPFQTIEVTLTLTVPEGITQDVSITFNTTVTSPVDPSSVNLTLSLQSTVIHPTSTETTLPYLGNITNPPDNIVSVDDTIVVVHTLDVPNNPSTPFTIFAITTYNTDSGIQQLVDDLDFVIVRPELNITTEALSVRQSRVAYTEDLNFDLTIERADSTFPDYDILLDVTLELPSGGILTPSLGDLSVDTLSVGESLVTVMLSRSTLSYVSNVPVHLFHFEGNMLPNLTIGQVLRLNGSVIYSVDPSTSVDYVQHFMFPDIHFLPLSLVAESLSLNSFIDNPERIVWELVLADIAGIPFDLTVDIFVDTAVLQLQFVEIISIGKGLDFLSTEFVFNSTFKSQIVFYNLTSVFNIRRGICSTCSVDIVMLVHTELVNEVGLRNSLVNATGHYSDLTVMIVANNVALVTDFNTTNPNTVGNVIQVGEVVTLNIVLYLPENMASNVTLNTTITQTLPMDYPVIVSTVSIVHIGANIVSTVLSVGDSDSAPYIFISNKGVIVEMGEVRNNGDGVMNEDDQVVVSVALYAQNTGTGAANQTITISCFIEEEPFIRDAISLTLIHPQLEMNLINVGPPGPYDGQDSVSISLEVLHLDGFRGAIPYDLQFSITTNQGLATSVTLESINTTGSSCSITSLSCSVLGSSIFNCASLPADCAASLVLLTELPVNVVSGSIISVTVTLQYDSNPFLTPHMGFVYTPLEVNFNDSLRVPIQLLALSNNLPTPNETVFFVLEIYLPEGITENVTINVNAVNGNRIFLLDLSIESVTIGENINSSSMEIMDNFPNLGDIFVRPDNNDLVPASDTLIITYSVTIPEGTYLENFTVMAETTFGRSNGPFAPSNGPSGSPFLSNSAPLMVILEPLLSIDLDVSHRLVDIGFTVVYNISLVFNVQPEIPNEVAVINTTVLLSSFVDPILPNIVVKQITQSSNLNNFEIDFDSLQPSSQFAVVLSLPIAVTENSSNEIVILAACEVDYAYTLFERVFTFAESFHNVYLANLSMTFSLVATSLDITEGNIITFEEIATWHVTITDIVGPAQNMTVNIASNDDILYITGLVVSFIGSDLTFIGTPLIIVVNETAMIVFHDLTLTDPEGYSGSCDCDILIEVQYTSRFSVVENQLVAIDVNVVYGSIQRLDIGDVRVTPHSELSINLFLVADGAEGGSTVPANITIEHSYFGSRDAHDLVITLPTEDQELIMSDNATANFSDGTELVFRSELLLENGGGFNISLLPQNQSVVIFLLYTFVPLTKLGRIIPFTAFLEYSNTNSSSAGYRDAVNDTVDVKLLSLNEINSFIIDSSSPYTNGFMLVVDEIFEITVRNFVRHGVSSPVFHTIFSTTNGEDLPIFLLGIESFLPNASTFVTSSNQTIEVIPYSPSRLGIIWSLGVVSNEPDGFMDANDLVHNVYTFAVSGNSSLVGIQIESFLLNEQTNETDLAPRIELNLVSPELTVLLNIEVLEEGNPRIARFTYVVLHTEKSSAPAISVNISNVIPSQFDLVSTVTLKYIEVGTLVNKSIVVNDSEIDISHPILLLGENITVEYLVQIDASLPGGFNITNPFVVHYASIMQEGIGLLYPNYIRRVESLTSEQCVRKVFNGISVDIIDYSWLLFWLIVGIVIGIILSVIVIVLYECCIYIRDRRVKRTVIPALLLGMVIHDDRDEDYLIFRERKRFLFSSLLRALPKDEWFETDDTYVGAESEYIAELEREFFYIEGKSMSRLMVYLLETRTSLKASKIRKAKLKFDSKVNELKSQLKESIRSEMTKQAYQSVSDKITREEEITHSHSEYIGEMQSKLSADMHMLEHFDKEYEMEKQALYSLIGLEKTQAELVIARQYMAHFMLGVKALMVQIVYEFYFKEKTTPRSIQELSSEVDEFILTEVQYQEEESILRGKRQMQCLLDKRIVELEDLYWEKLMLKLIESSSKEIASIQVDDAVFKDDIQENFQSSMKNLLIKKKELELEIQKRATADLERRARQLTVFIFSDATEFPSIESEIARWHTLQDQRESLLKEVEEEAIHELKEVWELHIKARIQLVEDYTTKVSQHMLSQGAQLQASDELLRHFSNKRLKGKEKLEMSTLILNAKFQAKVERHRQKMKKTSQNSRHQYEMKNKIEMQFLLDVTSNMDSEKQLEVIEQYHKDVAILRRSMALEKIRIYLKTNIKVSIQKKRKLQVLQTNFLQQLHSSKASVHIRRTCSSFLRHIQKLKTECYTTMFEEEQRKAEDDFTNERAEEIESISTGNIDISLGDYETDETPVSSRPVSSMSLRIDLANIRGDTKKLLTDHKENLIKVNKKLEAEKHSVAQTLEKKLESRRLQKVKAVMDLAVPDAGANPITKPSRFLVAVRKVMLSERLKAIREQHKKELENAVKNLQESYEHKQQEVFSDLERKFERHLLKQGKHSKEELIAIFRGIDSYQAQLRKRKRKKSRNYSVADIDPPSHFLSLPKVSKNRRLTCPDCGNINTLRVKK